MKIIKRNSDNLVVYASENLTLDSNGVSGTGFIDNNLTTANAELIDNITLPQGYFGGGYAYDSDTWVIANQAGYDNKLQLAKEAKLAEIKQARDEVVNGTTEITTSLGNTFIVDANIRNRSTMHQAITNSINAGFTDADTVNWRMGDNSYAPVSYGEMKEIGIYLGVFINDQFQKEALKIAEISGATLDNIDTIEW